MTFLEQLLSGAGFVGIAAVVLVAPWFFGAWEMWWFWPFAVLLFAATCLFAIRLFLRAAAAPASRPNRLLDVEAAANARFRSLCLATSVAFLCYAAVRFLQADVFLDAERSFLLFLTPFLLGVQVVYGWSRSQARILYALIVADLFLLGAYGIVNHSVTGSRLVLWAPGYEKYQIGTSRASGSYFCPDHFAGVLEIAFGLALAWLVHRGATWRGRLLGVALAGTAVWGVLLSKSRGGVLTLLAVTLAWLVWGLRLFRPRTRWALRAGAALLLVVSLLGVWRLESGLKKRFTEYFAWDEARQRPLREMPAVVLERLQYTSRGQMIPAALRAWREHPVFGIGPGMHPNVWPEIAATPDGDRARGVWPSFPNYRFHSYRVHSDWVQLLEEYGAVGFGLFAAAALAVLAALLTGLRRDVRNLKENGWRPAGGSGVPLALGGFLACVAMAFHSLGDFNLQMPATTWLFAAVLALSLAAVIGDRSHADLP